MSIHVAPLSREAARALARAGAQLRGGADAAASELRAAWAGRPLGPGGHPEHTRRWLGCLLYRVALRLDPELREP